MKNKVSIIVPVFNEEKTVVKVLHNLLSLTLPFEKEIIVVNDGSTDKTYDKIKSLKKIKIISYKKNKGKGFAVRNGIGNSKGNIIVIQDADLEYNPKNISLLIKNLTCDNPVVYGSRFLDKKIFFFGKKKIPLISHYIGNKLLTGITNLLYNANLTDMETCYKVFYKSILDNIELKAKGFEFEPEITSKILKNGFKIKEVSINHAPRTYKEGKKIRKLDGIKALFYLIKYRFFD